MPTLTEIAKVLDGQLTGDGALVPAGLSRHDSAEPASLVVAFDQKALDVVEAGAAGAVVVPEGLSSSLPCISVDEPRGALLKLLHLFTPDEGWEPGIHPTASVHPGATIPADAAIGAFAVVGKESSLGVRCRIGAHSVVGAYCQLGDDVTLHANVTLYPRTAVGNRAMLHSGSIIGGNGFGFYEAADGFNRIPQIGSVVLEDDVEIGCNSCVDRATMGHTVLRRGCKLDNLVQVAHNVEIGEHGRLTGQVGIAGSTTIGKRVLMGGKAGTGDHLTIGDNVTLAALTGAVSNMGDGGVWMGIPQMPIKDFYRIAAAKRHLPELLRRVSRLEKKLGK